MFRPSCAVCRSLELTSRSYSIVRPGKVAPTLSIPSRIARPPNLTPGYFTKNFLFGRTSPEIKTEKQISGMRSACALAAEILRQSSELCQPGVTTNEIDEFVTQRCVNSNSYPSPLLYKGFPKSVCTSVNNVACHGIPDDRPLEDGDIVNIDITVRYDVAAS